MSVKQIGKTRREPLTDSQLLMTITIGIFAVMYAAAMIFMGGGFLRTQQFFDLLNDNAALIIISCALTIVMIGGGINISVGGVIGLTVMACALYLNSTGIQDSTLGIVVTFLLALGIGLAFGVLQGFLISYLDIQPFIVTLAGMFLSRGLTTMLSVNPAGHSLARLHRQEWQPDPRQAGNRGHRGAGRGGAGVPDAAVHEAGPPHLRPGRQPAKRLNAGY